MQFEERVTTQRKLSAEMLSVKNPSCAVSAAQMPPVDDHTVVVSWRFLFLAISLML